VHYTRTQSWALLRPATAQFLSVDPDVAETGEPYAFVGNDPLNATDPLGLSGGWNRATLAYARRHTCGYDRRRCESAWHRTVHAADAVRHYVAAHKRVEIATAGVVLGTVALAIPGAEGVGAEVDQASFASLAGESELAPSAGLQAVKAIAGTGAAAADAEECGEGSLGSCAGAILGGASVAQPLDLPDEFLSWVIESYKYAMAH
jgi:hypothetical protein